MIFHSYVKLPEGISNSSRPKLGLLDAARSWSPEATDGWAGLCSPVGWSDPGRKTASQNLHLGSKCPMERYIYWLLKHYMERRSGLVGQELQMHTSCTVHLATSQVHHIWIPGWWFGPCFMFTLVGNNHPNWRTHIFQRGRSTTNQIHVVKQGWRGFLQVSRFSIEPVFAMTPGHHRGRA